MAFKDLGLSSLQGENSNQVFFAVKKKTETFQQDKFDKTTVSIQFEAVQEDGSPVENLSEKDLRLLEDSTLISKFKFQPKSVNTGRKADIVFAIDSTRSMRPHINLIKVKVSTFIEDLKKTNIDANVCLVLFGDTVRKACDKFVEDDPSTLVNENLESFLNELSLVQPLGGGDDPENQLGGLMAAAQTTPWHKDAQRIAILVTDTNFHFAPDFLGEAPSAPTYNAALDAMTDQKVSVFAVSPSHPGYNLPFRGKPSLTDETRGEWFDLNLIKAGSLDMSLVFTKIIERLQVNYTVIYTVDDYPTLDPAKPLKDRKVVVELKAPLNAKVLIKNISSNLPMGQPTLQSKFKVLGDNIDKNSLSVSVNGDLSSFKVEDDSVVLKAPPPAGARIEVSYFSKSPRGNVNLVLIPLKSKRVLEVTLNDVAIDPSEYSLETIEGRVYLELSPKLFKDEGDRFRIMKTGGLLVRWGYQKTDSQ